ncbi:MAG: aquaporin [Candidatus Dadabacteria bacterium]|nr:aquaporin [Candidatus Dadabacteria bacterium]
MPRSGMSIITVSAAVAVMVSVTMSTSGGHLNPAVTIAL